MVLYHAISSYQLLEVILHRYYCHKREKSILILPDFIIQKYPQYKNLVKLGLFDEVYLFPYLYIPHRPETIINNVSCAYKTLIPHDIHNFSEIYVAGAHFYFSLYLIEQNISFYFFEDAAGMLSRSDELYQNLSVNFPMHAQIAQQNGLFDGSCKNIKGIYCLKRAQTPGILSSRCIDFDVEKKLQKIFFLHRNRMIRFFLHKKIKTSAEVILLTQHLANLGVMTETEQAQLYRHLRENALQDTRLIIKKHPDDTLNYHSIFPDAQIIEEIFPSELLPYVFRYRQKPSFIATFSSTGTQNLNSHFRLLDLKE